MLKLPRLKYSYHAEFLDDDKIMLTSEKENVLLTGKPYYLVLSVLQNGGIETSRLMHRLEDRLSPFEMMYVLNILEEKGYLTETAADIPESAAVFWDSLGIDVSSLQEILRVKQVSVETPDPAATGNLPEVFQGVFAEMGLNTGDKPDLRVVVTDNYQHEQLREINRQALAENRAWMLVKPTGVQQWLGPVFQPGRTGCWECLNQRLTIHSPHNSYYRARNNNSGNIPVPQGFLSGSLQSAAARTAREIIKWFYSTGLRQRSPAQYLKEEGDNVSLEGIVWTFDEKNLESRKHRLMKRPQCPACGEPVTPDGLPEPLVMKKKNTALAGKAGGYRAVTADETLERYAHLVSPITGVVKALKPYFRQTDTPVHNYSSGPNTALKSKTLSWLNSHVRSSNGGKGKTATQAKTGALCEAVERYCMTYLGEEYHTESSLNQLGDSGIHPNQCMNFSRNQYRHREEINKECTKFFAMVPVPFEPSLKTDWTPVYSLTRQRFKYLPTQFCYTQYPAADEKRLFSYPDSNGCAAGNTIEEAVLQGLLELVERDAVALWWYNMIPRHGLDLESFDEPYFSEIKSYYRDRGRSLRVLDLTSDLGIPVFAAVSHRPRKETDNHGENILFGFGAHVDAKIAAERAVVELNQLLPIADAPGTDWKKRKYLTTDRIIVDWLNNATMENQPYLAPMDNSRFKTCADYRQLCDPTIYDSVEYCRRQVEQQDMEVLVLDLTRRDIRLPVVRVFVPGLRHFWKRLGPGRLYDVPVKTGWLDTARNEEQMNPIGLFI
jgi:oxazoline/thiazoline synthase